MSCTISPSPANQVAASPSKPPKHPNPTIPKELKIVAWCFFRRIPFFSTRRPICFAEAEWIERTQKWRSHVSNRVGLSEGLKTVVDGASCLQESPEHLDKQILHLAELLRTIDGKIAMILTFLGLISVATVVSKIPLSSDHPLIKLVEIVLLVLWLTSVMLCLWAIWRVIWGDLSDDNPGVLTSTRISDLKIQADYLIDDLIEAVISRTAKYRIAVYLTAFAVLCGVITLVGSQWPSPQGSTNNGTLPVQSGKTQSSLNLAVPIPQQMK